MIKNAYDHFVFELKLAIWPSKSLVIFGHKLAWWNFNKLNLFELAQELRGPKLDKGKEKSDRIAAEIVRQHPR